MEYLQDAEQNIEYIIGGVKAYILMALKHSATDDSENSNNKQHTSIHWSVAAGQSSRSRVSIQQCSKFKVIWRSIWHELIFTRRVPLFFPPTIYGRVYGPRWR